MTGRASVLPFLKAFHEMQPLATRLRSSRAAASGAWPIDITPGVFYKVVGPDYAVGIPAKNKHVAMTPHPPSGRIYCHGGDYQAAYGQGSYNQGVHSFDAANWYNAGGGNADWVIEYPYEGYGGSSVQPKYPDYCSFEWDSTRNVFWMFPGTMVVASGGTRPTGETAATASDTNYVWMEPMTFDPVAAAVSRWQRTGALFYPAAEDYAPFTDTWYTKHDPIQDKFFRIHGHDGDFKFSRFNPTTLLWGASEGFWPTPVRLWKDYLTTDHVGGWIYGVDGFAGKLYRLNMAGGYLQYCGLVPHGAAPSGNNFTYIQWDALHGVLYSMEPVSSQFCIYTPGIDENSGTWETISAVCPDSTVVCCRTIVFDPANNVLIMSGLSNDEGVQPYYFLYRYAE